MDRQAIQRMLQFAEQEVVYAFISAYAESDDAFCRQLRAAILPESTNVVNKEAYLVALLSC